MRNLKITNREQKDRERKIKFLQGLASGKRSISELIDQEHLILLDCEDELGAMYEPATGRRFNAAQIEAMRKNKSHFIVEL